jgi:hypothetical protein
MKGVELYAQVRYAVQIEGLSRRTAARHFGIAQRTVAKMLAFLVPPGYRRSRLPARPKLDPFTESINGILAADESRPRKQRHTLKRIFERPRDGHGYGGGITIVKDDVRTHRLRHREVFVSLRHNPGHAQVDFGEALAAIAGVGRKIHFFCDGPAAQRRLFCASLSERPPKPFVMGTTPGSRFRQGAALDPL